MDPTSVAVLAFIAVVSLVVLLAIVFGQTGEESLESRLNSKESTPGKNLDDPFALSFDEEEEKHGIVAYVFPFLNEATRRQMGERLVQAGLYRRNSSISYIMFKLLAVFIPVGIALFAHFSGIINFVQAFFLTSITGVLGLIAPGFYLDRQRKKRQSNLRRALPDALDVIIVCVEGGLSLPAAFAKVGSELSDAHPLLATEMIIVEREIQLGRTTGEALRNFSKRFDMEELRGLSSVVLQAEKFGSSVVRALRIYADSLREKRMMQAEELANQATVKILFPTLFCIFPALFVVILGPAAFDILEYFGQLGLR